MKAITRMVLMLAAQEIAHQQWAKDVREELSRADTSPDPACDPVYESSRKRAQWKNETNYRGRNR